MTTFNPNSFKPSQTINNINININPNIPEYLASWITNEPTRANLIKKIQNRKINNQIDKNKVIDQLLLSQQFFRSWMEQPVNTPLQRLVMHPLLLSKDQKRIDEYVTKERNNQIKYSLMFTAGTVVFYSIFFSRMAKFQRFFNNRDNKLWVNRLKKVLAVYGVVIMWQAVLSSHYQKKVPQTINEMGLFKQYGIQYQEKNV